MTNELPPAKPDTRPASRPTQPPSCSIADLLSRHADSLGGLLPPPAVCDECSWRLTSYAQVHFEGALSDMSSGKITRQQLVNECTRLLGIPGVQSAMRHLIKAEIFRAAYSSPMAGRADTAPADEDASRHP